MIKKSEQVLKWKSDFGNEYIDRNEPTEERIKIRLLGLTRIFDSIKYSPPSSILECGCNIGLNLRALSRFSSASLFAIEPNGKAREILIKDNVLPEESLFDTDIEHLPFDDASIDLVFTSGVLIHVPPERLEKAYSEIYRVSRKHIMAIEYFSKNPETLEYYGNADLLFKRDFGALWLDLYPDLKPIDEGFFWSRTTGFDDATWWIFEK